MKWDTVQLMVYGENLAGVKVRSVDDKLKILSVHSLENDSYLFVDVFIFAESFWYVLFFVFSSIMHFI